jgi:hypothetical protein
MNHERLLGTIVVVALILGSLAFAFGPELMRDRKRAALLREGSDAIATIARLDETGDVYNDQPEVRVTLVVRPLQGEAYQAQVTLVLSAVDLVHYSIGAEVPVKYDPAKPADVALAGVPQPPTLAAKVP